MDSCNIYSFGSEFFCSTLGMCDSSYLHVVMGCLFLVRYSTEFNFVSTLPHFCSLVDGHLGSLYFSINADGVAIRIQICIL